MNIESHLLGKFKQTFMPNSIHIYFLNLFSTLNNSTKIVLKLLANNVTIKIIRGVMTNDFLPCKKRAL